MNRQQRRAAQRAPRAWRRAPFLSVSEAARVWGVSKSLAYEWAAAGRFTVEDVGAAARVPRSEVERVLSQVEVQRPVETAPLFTGAGTFTDAWLTAVLADPRLDDETRAVARWLASNADDAGNLSPAANAVLTETLGDAS